MPILERLICGAKAVSASRGQPAEIVDPPALELDAIVDQFLAALVIGALTGVAVEQFAGDVGKMIFAGIVILKLVQAAAPAAVAQGFPLAPVEACQGLFPKRFSFVHRRCSHGRA